MDADHLPAQIAVCSYCRQPLYEAAPISRTPGLPAHVACVVHGRLDHRPYLADAAPAA